MLKNHKNEWDPKNVPAKVGESFGSYGLVLGIYLEGERLEWDGGGILDGNDSISENVFSYIPWKSNGYKYRGPHQYPGSRWD